MFPKVDVRWVQESRVWVLMVLITSFSKIVRDESIQWGGVEGATKGGIDFGI